MDGHWGAVNTATSLHLIAHVSGKGAFRVLVANTKINNCLTGSRGFAGRVSIEAILLLCSPQVGERPCQKKTLQKFQSETSKMPTPTVKSTRAMVG